jgi:hypothetical protein
MQPAAASILQVGAPNANAKVPDDALATVVARLKLEHAARAPPKLRIDKTLVMRNQQNKRTRGQNRKSRNPLTGAPRH